MVDSVDICPHCGSDAMESATCAMNGCPFGAGEEANAGPHDYYVVATRFLRHYPTYEAALQAKVDARAMMGAGNNTARKRSTQLRIYRCHSFGRKCEDPPGDGGQHASDCAMHNMPALPAGACDCRPDKDVGSKENG